MGMDIGSIISLNPSLKEGFFIHIIYRIFYTMKDYTVTQDQFLSLGHYNRMFEHYSDMIMKICTKSYDDEISLGFELGKLHADLRDSYLSMMELLNDIRNGEESPKISLDQTFPWGTTTNDMVPYHTICGCNPANGGSGICGCIMANQLVSKGGGFL